MSKKLIAGAGVVASLAVALAPLATFAESVSVVNHTDTLKLNIPAVCTLGTIGSTGEATAATDETAHTDGTGAWATTGEGTVAAATTNGKTDVLAATVYTGQTYENLGKTTFKISCNNATGYKLTAKASAANLANGSYYIATADGASYVATTDGTSYWNFKFSDASTGLTIAEGYDGAHAVPTADDITVVSKNTAGTMAGENVTVTYGAGIDNYQEAGTYTGSVVYTLAQL